MTTTDAQKWLGRVRGLDREIIRLIEARAQLMARLTRTTTTYKADIVQSTASPHKMDSLAELADEIDAEADRLAETRSEVLLAILHLEDWRHRAVLSERYLSGKKWEQIAVDAGYSWRQIHRLHRAALAAMAEYLEERR